MRYMKYRISLLGVKSIYPIPLFYEQIYKMNIQGFFVCIKNVVISKRIIPINTYNSKTYKKINKLKIQLFISIIFTTTKGNRR